MKKKAVKQVRSGLVLSPFRLTQDQILIEILEIDKHAGKPAFAVKAITLSELRQSFPHIPKSFIDRLLYFNADTINLKREQAKRKHNTHKAGIGLTDFYRTSMLRHLHESFEGIKPFAPTIDWYHKSVNGDRFKTAPCSYSSYRPTLHFKLSGTKENICLNTEININESLHPLEAFRRSGFLLESNNEYFLLSFRDMQTLDWLSVQRPETYAADAAGLISNILAKLEQDYRIERNNLLDNQVIEALPVARVLLSEISNSFLMMTPQWVYEGFLIEGPWKAQEKFHRNGIEYIIHRHKESELELINLLESLHSSFCNQCNGYYYLPFADAQKSQWFAKVYHRLIDADIEVTGMDMLKQFRYSPFTLKSDFSYVKEQGDLVIIHGNCWFGTEKVGLADLQKTIISNQTAVLLQDGSLGLLDEHWLQENARIIKAAKISGDDMIVPRWLAFSEHETKSLSPVINKSWLQNWLHWQHEGLDLYEVDPRITAKLRPYQQKGFEWMMLLAEAGAGGCLADDMGLGKTLQSICFINALIKKFPGSRHLVICPSSLMYNWKKEWEKFAPHVKAFVYHGASRSEESLQDPDHEVVITSYATLRIDFHLFSCINYQTLLVDESHNIKNPAAQITKLLGQLKPCTRIALSGTPVMNNTFDLYSQLDFLLPGIFGSKERFKKEFADPIDRDNDPLKIAALHKLTAPFILRRTKEQVASDLPAKSETILWCEMGSAQREQYEAVRLSISSSLFLDIKKDGLQKTKLAVLHGILKLRQVCDSPLLLPVSDQTCSDSVKLHTLMDELVNNLGNHKAIVFSQFTGMLDMIAEESRKRSLKFYHFDGQTPPDLRHRMVENFQSEGDTTSVFLISLKAGNAGLNLTAADYVFLFDPWWNTAVQQQAIDRTHRIGQTKKVFAYKMVCRDTIEEKIIQLQERKKNLADDLISEDNGFVKSLSEEDIAFLFG